MKRVPKELGAREEAVLWQATEYSAVLAALKRGEVELPAYNKAVMALLECAAQMKS